MGRSRSSNSLNEKHIKNYHTTTTTRTHSSHSHHNKEVRKKSIHRNSSNHHQRKTEIHQHITKKVYNMINEAKKHSTTTTSTRHHHHHHAGKHKKLPPACGCPYHCEQEIQSLHDSIETLRAGLNVAYHKERPIFQLDHFIDDHYQLLSEAWISIGPSKLKDLVSANLLSICSRRERKDMMKQTSSSSSSGKNVRVSCIIQPYVSFNDGNDYQLGISELWHRCIQELNDLSIDQIKTILNGTVNLDPMELVRQTTSTTTNTTSSSNTNVNVTIEKENCTHSSPSKLNLLNGEKHSDMEIHDADSTTALCSVLENQFDAQKTNEHCCCMSGNDDHDHDDSKLHTNSQSLTNSKEDRIDEKSTTNVSAGTCRSISESSDLVDLVHQEITELEMRARAIRAMLKTKSDQFKA
ncbi:unnamed protein product [Schistosoma turkestanicum]|nr:unnamed protein product [Schistosoma turkestanicum]CAH8472029.1 unnamed protein product [Schistosoma turkestanicum]